MALRNLFIKFKFKNHYIIFFLFDFRTAACRIITGCYTRSSITSIKAAYRGVLLLALEYGVCHLFEFFLFRDDLILVVALKHVRFSSGEFLSSIDNAMV